MTKKLLVTDSFFITNNQIDDLRVFGYEIVHLDKPQATEDELIEAIQGVSVYILGGIEQVSQPIIDAADKLEAIVFPGVDYDKFMPAADYAKSKGIEIFNAPGGNAIAVAEFAFGIALLMQRRLVEISRVGNVNGVSTGSIEGSIVGVIGAGNIGQKLIEVVQPFHPKEIVYYNRSKVELSGRQVELEELVRTADIIFLALPMKAGEILTAELVSKLKQDSLLISVSPMNLINTESLLGRVRNNEVRAAIDWPNPSEDLKNLPLERWYTVNSHSAFNTKQAVANEGKQVVEKVKSLFDRKS
jgi:D-3-phosphoglycerate dehydrogenase